VQGREFRGLVSDIRPGGRCLNAGCGEGLYAPLLEAFPGFNSIVNIDLSRADHILRREDPRHQVLLGSITALPLADGAFDFCLCSEVLEHVADDSRAVDELARVLKPGGYLLLSVPTPPAPHDPAHIREGYTLEGLKDLMGRAGFEIVRHVYCMRSFMRLLMRSWRWQFATLGLGRRNLAPRAYVRALARLDQMLPVGRPWDLAVLARRLPVVS